MKIYDISQEVFGCKVYPVSLCKNGILGGLLYLKEAEMVYCTNKLTLPERIRRLHMPYCEISEIQKAPWHTVAITLNNREAYRFLVFSREHFLKKVQAKIQKRKLGEQPWLSL